MIKVVHGTERVKHHVSCSYHVRFSRLLFNFTDDAMIIYISRGLLSRLTEAGEVMDIISMRNARLYNKVIINTYAVIDGMCGYLGNNNSLKFYVLFISILNLSPLVSN